MKAAVYCATRNLYPDLIPAIKSLVAHSDVDRVYLLIEDDEFPFPLPDFCEAVNVSGQTYFTPGCPNYASQWTYMVLMRAVLWDIFPNLDRVLSLDVDTFINKDVSDLWELDMTHKLLAGVEETSWLKEVMPHYINAGVLMQNLALLRSSGAGAEVYAGLKRRKWEFPEQDVFNVVCSGSILFLPREYNAGRGTEPYGTPFIRHFMGEGKTYRNSVEYQYWNGIPWTDVLRKYEARKA